MSNPMSPEVLDALPEYIAALYRELDVVLLHEIVERLKISDNLNEVTVQDIRALRRRGIKLNTIIEAIRKLSGKTKNRLKTLFADVVKRNQKYYKEQVTLSGLTAPTNIVGAKDIDALQRQTEKELMNITRSMGYVVGDLLLPPGKAYQWALDMAVLKVQTGAISYTEAISDATKALADSGLQVVEYDSGHKNSVDVAVRRAVMTGINQLNRRYDEQSMDLLKTDLVEVSAHAGARDKGVGFQNHKSWQGKVYRWARYTEKYPKASKKKYPDFETTCGYGDVQGILGANCRHKWTPFVEGVMERTYTDEQLANIDKPPFTYEGKQYTTYEATQKQRQIETAVRHWTRREAAAVTAEDKLAAQARIRALKAKYTEFSKAAGLRTQPQRMAVYVPKN